MIMMIMTIVTFLTRYMTLTHSCNTPWADAAQVESGDFPVRADGITQFGQKVGSWVIIGTGTHDSIFLLDKFY